MRCAIYARKSHDEAVDTKFGSIEAQRELCVKYIESQVELAWFVSDQRYDDPGFSGGNLNRPALARLLKDIEAGEVNIVVVYKIDRLSRSMRDFLELMALFERHGVTFVAVTQSFNTTTSMGRLTLNVLLSFAQFEREVSGERLRDWFAGARARGLWKTGRRPFGYQVNNGVLEIDPQEADTIRLAFKLYPKIGSMRTLAKYLASMGALNKSGQPIKHFLVARILQNPLYLGRMRHKGDSIPGFHQAIVTDATFSRVQLAIAESGRRRKAKASPPVHALLQGLIYTHDGRRMIHTYIKRRGRLYRYYISGFENKNGRGSNPTTRTRADEIESKISDFMTQLTGGQNLGNAQLRKLLDRIELGEAQITVKLLTGGQFVVDR